ncbi:hypothetical protein O3P69_002595 [Scylla paramamosain]|uniref:Ubiquitin-like protease family profile domain-containing protein n=1 Tax=Scylla paramamosain TaxID=85552 RepID=A0AAW0ULA5_SCYPA
MKQLMMTIMKQLMMMLDHLLHARTRLDEDIRGLLLSSYVAQRSGQLAAYDSLHSSLSTCTTALLKPLQEQHVPPPGATVRPVQRQNDGHSCGLFTLAFAFSIAGGQDPCTVRYDRASMAPHLVRCLQLGVVQPFPSVPAGRDR